MIDALAVWGAPRPVCRIKYQTALLIQHSQQTGRYLLGCAV